MKLHILSDLHNEISPYSPHLRSYDADLIILAGDIGANVDGILWARKTWPDQAIIYIAGNHEFYRGIRLEILDGLRKTAKESNVIFLENDTVVFDGVRFIGCTLWTDFELFGADTKQKNMLHAPYGLLDYKMIFETDKKTNFTPVKSLDLNAQSVFFLKEELNKSFDGETVVVTHHLPSIKSISAKYIDDPLSAGFASNLDHLLGKSELWIHGHTHDSFDYRSKGTRVICNPRGYSTYRRPVENFNFKPDLLVDI